MTHQKWRVRSTEPRVCVFEFLLIEISSRKAVPEVTSTFPGPLHHTILYHYITLSYELSRTSAVGNVKLFNNHSGSRGLPSFIKGIYWATGLFLRTPFTEGCAGANKKASPPGRHRNRRVKNAALLDPLRSVQFVCSVSRLVTTVQAMPSHVLAEGKPSLDPLRSIVQFSSACRSPRFTVQCQFVTSGGPVYF